MHEQERQAVVSKQVMKRAAAVAKDAVAAEGKTNCSKLGATSVFWLSVVVFALAFTMAASGWAHI